MDQVFTRKMIGEIDKMGYVCSMDLEKAYDWECRWKLFKVLREGWELEGILLKATKPFMKSVK